MLHVRNVTRNTTLIEKGRMADNFFTRLKGLTGVRHLPDGDGILIKPCNSVHTHFMSIPIDVLFVNGDDHIVDIVPQMTTWRIERPRRQARYVIELPSGMAERTKSKVGDKLEIKS